MQTKALFFFLLLYTTVLLLAVCFLSSLACFSTYTSEPAKGYVICVDCLTMLKQWWFAHCGQLVYVHKSLYFYWRFKGQDYRERERISDLRVKDMNVNKNRMRMFTSGGHGCRRRRLFMTPSGHTIVNMTLLTEEVWKGEGGWRGRGVCWKGGKNNQKEGKIMIKRVQLVHVRAWF